MGRRVWHIVVGRHLIAHGVDINVGDEGGFAPDLTSVEECLDLLVETIAHCNYSGKVAIALDVAASGMQRQVVMTCSSAAEFHLESNPGHYDLDGKRHDSTDHRILNGEQMVQYYLELIGKYPSRACPVHALV